MSTNKKILVIENEKPLRDTIKFKLEKQDIKVIATSNAEEMIEFLKKHH